MIISKQTILDIDYTSEVKAYTEWDRDIEFVQLCKYQEFANEFCTERGLRGIKVQFNGRVKRALGRYVQRYHTNVVGYLQLSERSSRYGAIGGAGKTGYRWLDSLDKLFDISCDYLTASIEDDGLNIVYIDHDGVNSTTLKFVTEAMVEPYYTAGKWYDLDEFVEERIVPTAKPTQAYWFKKFA